MNGNGEYLELSFSIPGLTLCRMKVSGEQFEDRIVEVHWDPTIEGWRMMRFRDDKPAGNHIGTVESVIQSIRDGVEKETVRVTQHLRNGLILTASQPSSSRNAGPSGRPGKLGTASRPNHLPLPTSVSGDPISLPLSPNRGPCPILTPNLRTRAPIPTYRRGICSCNSNTPSRMLRLAFKVVLYGHHRKQVPDFRYRMERSGTGHCKRRSGVG